MFVQWIYQRGRASLFRGLFLRYSAPSPLIGKDELISKWSDNRKFTVKSAYSFIQNLLNPVDNKWKLAWSFTGPQRVRQFFWSVFKELLLTNAERYKREWKPPPLGYIKLNMDGARSPNSWLASAAVVERGNVGRWLEGMGRNIGKYCAQAIAATLDKTRVQSNRDLVIRIQELCRRDWQVDIRNVSREANVVAHTLTRLMRNLSYGLKMFKEILTKIIEHIRIDDQLICNNIDLSL
ncbi:hypothetical protein Golob_002682 [Gossypium lobatum]|uniref:RNase H type-1 domain-containing protein n=1 Tax=Gossypium lobatum TaxID=34289 RepID=A0A7J8N653_9ROSI|nr:hypothetical protein [Gossypium lobatum]